MSYKISGKFFVILLILFGAASNGLSQNNNSTTGKDNPVKKDTVIWNVVKFKNYTINYTDSDAGNFMTLKSYLDRGIDSVENFFGSPYPDVFSVFVYPNRASLDQHWQRDWGVPGFKSQCWMVASGVAERLDILSPSVWLSQACEHDPGNKKETQDLITHELVHVYHGQNNPHPNFADMDDIGWFVEGLAVFVSGQLNKERIDRAKNVLHKGEDPKELKSLWGSKNKYGFSGLMVKYIFLKYGKQKLISLLPQTTEKGILSALNITASKLLKDWRGWILRNG